MKKNISNHTGGYLGAFMTGLIFCAAFLALILCLAFLFHAGLVEQGREGLLLRGGLVLTVFLSALSAGRRVTTGKLLNSAVSLSVFVIFLLLIGVFTKDSAIFNISFLYDILAVICGGFAGGMLSAKSKNRRKR